MVAKLKCEEASVARHLEHHQAQLASAEQAVVLCREVGDEFGLMRAQQIAGNALYDSGGLRRGAHRVGRSIERGTQIWVTERDRATSAELACASMDDHEFEAAHGYLDEAFPLLEAADDRDPPHVGHR